MSKPRPMTNLQYAFDTPPSPAELIPVAEGVFWLRMPLPFRLDHINLWVLEDEDGWIIVDSGVATDDTTTLWLSICGKLTEKKPIKRVIITHLHPDHIGLAGWLCRQHDAELWISREEYLLCRMLLEDGNREAPDEAISFYRAAGFTEEQLHIYHAKFGSFGNLIRGLPNSYHRMQDGDNIAINGKQWHLVSGAGHCPEHICLHCPELNVFIAGDQLLPTISSNVSVWPYEPDANPLKDWMDSCQKLHQLLPPTTLILPSHGLPFVGAQTRLEALLNDHKKDLETVVTHCTTPKRVVDLFPLIFNNPVTPGMWLFATGESYAHLNYLMAEGKITVNTDSDRVNWYTTLDNG